MELELGTSVVKMTLHEFSNLLESGTKQAACVEPQQRGSCVTTPGTPDMILQHHEAGSISTQCSVSSRGKVLNEEDTRLGR
jgi:hypothetical protein